MPLYLLKAGSHTTGIGEDAAYYSAKDPKNNVVESDQPLDELMPEKFAKHEGPAPQKEQKKAQAQNPPPGPPDEAARAEAELASGDTPRTPQVLKERAKRLREMADALEKSASQAQSKQEEAAEQQESEEEEGGEETLSKAQKQKKAQQEEKSKTASAQKSSSQKAQQEAEAEEEQAARSEEEKKAQQEDAKLEQMTLPELRATAHKENVQAHAGMRKEEVVEAIRKSRKKG